MPYPNVPEELWDKMDSCVDKVMAGDDSLDKESAIAICHESVAKEKAVDKFIAVSGGKMSADIVVYAQKSRKKDQTWVAKAGQFISSRLLRDSKGQYSSTRLKSTIHVYKDVSGKYRWVLLTSNSLEDRDREVISQKALEADVARADKDQDYGPLRWWHVPGLDLGVCDWNAMHGRVLMESGTFHHESVGKAIKEHASELGASIGFLHPIDQPDAEGVYYTIRRYERSLLPREEAANPYTVLVVEQEKNTMLKAKESQLRELLKDVDGSLVDQIIGMASETESKALEAGVRHKEAEPAAPVAEEAPAEEAPAEEAPAEEAPSEEETAKEESLEERTSRIRSAIYAALPQYPFGPMSPSWWTENVYEGYAIIVGEANKMYQVPYTDTGSEVIVAPSSSWVEVQREVSYNPVSKERAASASVESATAFVTQKALSILVKEDRDEEEEAPIPPKEEAAPPAEEAPVPPTEEEEEKQPAEEEQPAAAPPGEEAPELNENTPVGDLTLGQLGEVVGAVVMQAMSSRDEKVQSLENIVGTRHKEHQELAAEVAGLKESDNALKQAMDVLIGQAPRSKAREARASMSEDTKLEHQSEDVQRLKDNSLPKPDAGLNKFMDAIIASSGSPDLKPLVLGGAPKE